jgi:hypothetical protein
MLGSSVGFGKSNLPLAAAASSEFPKASLRTGCLEINGNGPLPTSFEHSLKTPAKFDFGYCYDGS